MPNPKLRLKNNVDGDFYVDSTCINCDTCRQLAPSSFEEEDGYSYVFEQPKSVIDVKLAMRAVIACPTGSIGHNENQDRMDVINEFPIKLDEDLFYCGYHSPKSFGGASYFVRHNDQNWLIDSPRYSRHLVQKFKEFGGIDFIFLTHRDDVADADKYQRDFDAKRIIHHFDKSAEPKAEIVIKGYEPQEFSPGIKIIPTPGHTKGHMCLLVDNRYLFTGDHLYWRQDWKGLRASRRMNWYSWSKQKESLKLLADYEFEWVLPGHGTRVNLAKDEMKVQMDILLKKIEKSSYY